MATLQSWRDALAITLAEIYRHPVKGLNAESLERVALSPDEALPHDRRFAIAHATALADSEPGAWQPRRNFLHLARDEKLAQVRARFDDENGDLVIERNGKQVARGKVTEQMGRTLVGQFFASFMAGSVRGVPRLVEAKAQPFTDMNQPYISIIGLASIKDLERVARETVDPRRFRANLYLEGSDAWEEFGWIDREITVGSTRLRVEARIDRCAATNVNPDTAARDLNIPLTLQRGFGHVDMGVYARVVEGGEIATGDPVQLA